jgi:transposase-like protein
LVLFADGIHLSDELAAVVAMGVTTTGEKVILDFELGSSENYEVAKDLLERIKKRGFCPAAERILAVTDGGAGLRKAIKGSFPNVVLQRCLVHKERNLKGRLSRKHHGQLAVHFKILRHAQSLDDAEAIVVDLKDFLAKHSKRALESLEEAGEELLAFHSLEVSSTLNVSLLSTNCIENAFRNTRHKTGRVTRWRADSDQPQRWLACAFTEAEKGFKRIRGYRDLKELKTSLDRLE